MMVLCCGAGLQLAALDYFGCVAADMFAMTDSGSQLSSLVAGQRIYEGGGHAPTIRPNKRRLASIFHDNQTIEWSHFEHRVRKAVKESQKIGIRPFGRSIYRYPRCEECMCKGEDWVHDMKRKISFIQICFLYTTWHGKRGKEMNIWHGITANCKTPKK